VDKSYPDVVAGAELLVVDALDDPDPALSPPEDFSGAEAFSADFSEPVAEPDDDPFLVVFPDSRLSVR